MQMRRFEVKSGADPCRLDLLKKALVTAVCRLSLVAIAHHSTREHKRLDASRLSEFNMLSISMF
jgi:hypothetical protein